MVISWIHKLFWRMIQECSVHNQNTSCNGGLRVSLRCPQLRDKSPVTCWTGHCQWTNSIGLAFNHLMCCHNKSCSAATFEFWITGVIMVYVAVDPKDGKKVTNYTQYFPLICVPPITTTFQYRLSTFRPYSAEQHLEFCNLDLFIIL